MGENVVCVSQQEQIINSINQMVDVNDKFWFLDVAALIQSMPVSIRSYIFVTVVLE